VTLEAQRYPSGRGGDFDVARWQSEQSGGQPVEQTVGIVTERGNETVTYGYDPTNPEPYSLAYPGPDGTPVTQRFRSMEAYGEWYENQPGTNGGSPHIDGEATPSTAAPGPNELSVEDLKQRAFEAEARAEELRRGDWASRARTLRETFAELEGVASSPAEIEALAGQELALLEALEAEIPPRPPEFEEGAHTRLAQEGGLKATERQQVQRNDGTLDEPSHPLTEHGPDTDPNWLRGMARTSRNGIAAKFTDRAVMETVTGDAITAAQPQVDAWLAGNPAAGENFVLPEYDPGIGNLGEGFYRNPATGDVEPIPANMALTKVQVILKATGNAPPGRAYIIQTSYPTLP
jgi:hypothetical protein